MNEEIIKNLVKYKLNLAESMLDSLPEKLSQDARKLGKLILDGVNEGVQEMKEKPVEKSKSSDKLENITIE
ncbi:MAG: hypothetical protein K0Q65_1398 [Clostridia bacterium]|jgi:phage-related protein|nr:hypothetical protein [Clostridia bacterium]